VSAQELISRFGNSHLVALSQLRSLAAAFASATDKTPTIAPVPHPHALHSVMRGTVTRVRVLTLLAWTLQPTVGQGDIDHTNCATAAHPSAIPHQWLLIHSLKMASERNRRPTAYEVTFSDDQSPTVPPHAILPDRRAGSLTSLSTELDGVAIRRGTRDQACGDFAAAAYPAQR
jgi:hypothetical protein